LDRVGEIPGRLRRCDSGRARNDGLPIRPEEDGLVLGDRPFEADDMPLEVALQFLNEVFCSARTSCARAFMLAASL
jgi:hypothetical protein